MSEYVAQSSLPDFSLWELAKGKRVPFGFDIELTARCNNNCRHCYINLPAGDVEAQRKELAYSEIESIADQAVELGALWVLITGGEPLLRGDFFDIYKMLKKKGLLVSVFTNACLVTEQHIELFKHFPPRDIEISVYGITHQTYEAVTRKPGSFAHFMHGFDLLSSNGIKIRLKAMALRSNVHELPEIARLCRRYTYDYFRFDPLLHLRYDRDPSRNAEINQERLTPEEIVAVEQSDDERSAQLQKNCKEYIQPENESASCDHLFHCGAGLDSFSISYDGYFRLCSTLHHPQTKYDLRQSTLADAWNEFAPRVRDMRSSDQKFLQACRTCPIVNLCLWCPANACLETGKMDGFSQYFCQVAHARLNAIQARSNSST